MSVTAAAGFVAAGVSAGLKSKVGVRDVAVVQNVGPMHSAAAVFTSNRCKANPVLWSQEAIADGRIDAVILNSGGANCYTGAFGFQTTHFTAEAVAESLDISSGDVFVCSTGLIGYGDQSFRDRVIAGGRAACAELSSDGGEAAAEAILTTDTHAKTSTVVHPSGWTIGGMAKGAGMLAPGLATMLVVITTDAVIDSVALDAALRKATRVTFDRLDSDGCMSTNDTVLVMASGASGVEPESGAFEDAITQICSDLAVQLQGDAEGATHDIDIEVIHSISEDEAVEVARSVARNNLFKAAIFGNDPNWGRVLAAIGTTSAQFDPYDVDVAFNGVRVCQHGEPDQPPSAVDLTARRVHIQIDLKVGDGTAVVRTNDLTHDYVHENSAYSS